VLLSNGEKVTFDRRVVAIPPACIAKSLAPLADPRIDYRGIKHQPFLYIYMQTDDPAFKERFTTYTVLPKPFQKLIPMNIEKGVYMVAYADNASALSLNAVVTSPESLSNMIKSVLGIRIKVNKYMKVFNEIGTHYRTNHKIYKLSAVFKGEAFAKNQGWTNGGL
jgi:hypothetical protein